MNRTDLAVRLNVADADVHSVEWSDGECYVVLRTGQVYWLHEVGFTVVKAVPAPTAPAPTPDDDEVPVGNASTVLAWVNQNEARARRALAAEQQRDRPRKGLLVTLEKLVADGI